MKRWTITLNRFGELRDFHFIGDDDEVQAKADELMTRYGVGRCTVKPDGAL